MLRWRRLTGVVLATMLLAGCTPQPDIYARLADGTLEIASCEDHAIERVTVSVWSEDERDWLRVWESEGAPISGSGRVVDVGIPPTGWSSDPANIDVVSVLASDSVSVKLWHSETGAVSQVFDATELSSSWSTGDGSSVTPACL